MAIYLDDYRGRCGRMVMSHLMSDESLVELHEFAAKLGLKKSWFQPGSAPHYDVCLSRRSAAFELGAIELPIAGSFNWLRVLHAARQLKK